MDFNTEAFIQLFKEAFTKCFAQQLTAPLSETESRHLSNKIFESTGLVIGSKSIKNYSFFVLNPAETKQENPSVATLDTLARYVLNAAYTDELLRKEKEPHFPYWFQYKNAFITAKQQDPVSGPEKRPPEKEKRSYLFLAVIILAIPAVTAILYFIIQQPDTYFADNFNSVSEDTLSGKGWFVRSKDETFWNRRNELANHLTLFTLRGDNWADSANKPFIRNLLVRKINADCFTAEVHIDDFIPSQRWQQAGILLLEDTAFSGKSLRLSLAYNDFFGGLQNPAEIILQGITSGEHNAANPEEIIHQRLFSFDTVQANLIRNNLKNSALRIEKTKDRFRFLYATSEVENFAFKEALGKELGFHPRYIALFALGGFVNSDPVPVHFSFFSFAGTACH